MNGGSARFWRRGDFTTVRSPPLIPTFSRREKGPIRGGLRLATWLGGD